jgi:transposase-like protein
VATHRVWPRKITLDGNGGSHLALRMLRHEDSRWQGVRVRSRRYLNNIVEQDHRAIKRRCAATLGFKFFRTAAITLAGIELAHRIRKRQFSSRRWMRRVPCWHERRNTVSRFSDQTRHSGRSVSRRVPQFA